MKLVEVLKNDNNVFESHILGDPAVGGRLLDYTFPGFSGFFGMIRLDEYNFLGHDEGYLYIFLDLLGYYSEEYGEYSLVPMFYYTKDIPTDILDDFNEDNLELEGINKMYMLDSGNGFDITDGKIIITDCNLLKFFSNFDNDIKSVILSTEEISLNKFSEGIFKIIKGE